MKRREKWLTAIAHFILIPVLVICIAFSVVQSNGQLKRDTERIAALEAEADAKEAQKETLPDPQEEPQVQPVVQKTKKNQEELKDGTYTGSGTGYGGAITVQVTVKDGAIETIEILSASGETPAFFNQAQAILPLMISAGSANVDAISGATLSSNGIKMAVAEALKQAGKKEEITLQQAKALNPQPAQKAKKEKFKKPKRGWKDGTYKGEATGFGGPVRVVVKIKKGKIKKITATGDSETAEYWSRAQAVISSILKKQSPEVDAVSGATYSSNGIINAVIAALNKAVINKKDKKKKRPAPVEEEETEEEDETVVVPTRPAEEETDPNAEMVNGTFNGSGTGYGGIITAVVEIKDSIIQSITVEGEEESDKYWFKAKKIIPKMINNQTWDVDAISGATLSSNGIRDAVKDALTQAGIIQ